MRLVTSSPTKQFSNIKKRLATTARFLVHLPAFFESAMKMSVRQLPTLEFKYKNNRAVSNTATLLGVLGKLPKYFNILCRLDAIVSETQPDLIINFFGPMAAFYAITRRRRPPVVAIGHQFMFQHPGYVHSRNCGNNGSA